MRCVEGVAGGVRLSATDLSNHIGCPHLTQLDLGDAHGTLKAPHFHDPRLDALQQRGLEHERRYVKHLEDTGRNIHLVEDSHDPALAFQSTVEAMRAGKDVIVQPTLTSGRWLGRADILLRVNVPSRLGDWSYEPADTKLTRETKAGTVLQLCFYAEIVSEIQGALPEHIHVVVPGRDYVLETYRTEEYFSYYRHVKGGLERAVEEYRADELSTYPEPVPQCDVCRWWTECDRRRRKDDHLSLVANISRAQRVELQERGVTTLAKLGVEPLPFSWRPEKGSIEGFLKAREQARIQLESRTSGEPRFELLPLEPARGLARLPVPSQGDLFFDFEGDPFVEPDGLEFLWGWVTFENATDTYHHRWSLNRTEELAAFEAFIDMVMERWSRFPDLHIYHYAPYEPSALKRLMGRYASRETEIDRLLRAGVFVDLYGVVRQSLRAGIERYSIKDLEVFFDYKRQVPLKDASAGLRHMECALELGGVDSVSAEDRDAVLRYNADDCLATRRLRDWLETLREQRVAGGDTIDRPVAGSNESSEKVTAWMEKVRPVREALLADLPTDASERTEAQQAQWMLAQMLEFHRRESKAPWWEFFRLAELGPDELLEERHAISGLQFVKRVGGTDRAPIHRYTFPFQEVGLDAKDSVQVSVNEKIGAVAAIDRVDCWVDIKKRQDAREKHPVAVFSGDVIDSTELQESLLRLASAVLQNGLPEKVSALQERDFAVSARAPRAASYNASRDLLLRRPPRLLSEGPLRIDGEDLLGAARRLALDLNKTALCIQGPPGTGKTYTAARMAVDLVRSGKTVGVCALSHKVIRNLLAAIVAAGKEAGVGMRCAQRTTETPDETSGIAEIKDNKDALSALADGSIRVLGGTAWVWAREEFAEAVDVLFLDEAGQFALANALAIAQGARSLVLVGDPQQLESPLQGSHPEGTEVSALHHMLHGHKTMPEARGLFIPDTRRLAPAICEFTSEQFYERRLQPFSGMEKQVIQGHASLDGAGLWYAPTPHRGNRNFAHEEVDRIAELVKSLLAGGVSWTNAKGKSEPLRAADVLIVSPYNAQVSELRRALPESRDFIGTVDKFQGQEAPVVIYSMATSAPEDAPRGMEFLYSLNRLNVATSRARCACILVANPLLLEPECRTPQQMRLANAFCRYLELARVL